MNVAGFIADKRLLTDAHNRSPRKLQYHEGQSTADDDEKATTRNSRHPQHTQTLDTPSRPCLPKSPTSSNSSKSAGARTPPVRFQTQPSFARALFPTTSLHKKVVFFASKRLTVLRAKCARLWENNSRAHQKGTQGQRDQVQGAVPPVPVHAGPQGRRQGR